MPKASLAVPEQRKELGWAVKASWGHGAVTGSLGKGGTAVGGPFPYLRPLMLPSLPSVPPAGGSGHVPPWEEDATGDGEGP